METKICSKCGKEKLINMFDKNRRCKNGISSICKMCRKIYRENNKERDRAYNKQYKTKHRDEINRRNRELYAENGERMRERVRRWCNNNLEKYRDSVRRSRKRNRDAYLEIERINRDILSDRYILSILNRSYGFLKSDTTPELIKAKRRQLKYSRQLRTLKEEQNETK